MPRSARLDAPGILCTTSGSGYAARRSEALAKRYRYSTKAYLFSYLRAPRTFPFLVKPYQLSVIKVYLRVIGLARVDIVDYDIQLARCRGERKQYPVFFG